MRGSTVLLRELAAAMKVRAVIELIEEIERLVREAIPLHIESLRANGDPVPPPTTVATTVIPPPAAPTSAPSDPQD
jgi:hypothetical protein